MVYKLMPMTLVKNFGRYNFPRMFRRRGYKIGAEVGVFRGRYSKRLCRGISNLKLYCVDSWSPYDSKQVGGDGKRFDEALRVAHVRLDEFNVTFIKKPSDVAVLDFEDGSLDFVYIDANHQYDYVMCDIILWNRKVRSGGIVSGHDYYLDQRISVYEAVNDYVNYHNISAFYTDEEKPSFWWIKE